jgi:hypothetical protein
MEEVDRKPELIAIEFGSYPQVRHKQDWHPLVSLDAAGAVPADLGAFFSRPLISAQVVYPCLNV